MSSMLTYNACVFNKCYLMVYIKMKKIVSLAVIVIAISSASFAGVAQSPKNYNVDFFDIDFIQENIKNSKSELDAAKVDFMQRYDLDELIKDPNFNEILFADLEDINDDFIEIKSTPDRRYAPLQPEYVYENGFVKQRAGFTFDRLPEIADVANYAYHWTGTNESNLKFNQTAKNLHIDKFKLVKAINEEKHGLTAISLLKDDILYVSYRGTMLADTFATMYKDLKSDLFIGLNTFTSYIQQIIKKGGAFTPAFLNTLVGSLIDGALSSNVQTAADFLLNTVEAADIAGLKYRKLIVAGHSLGGFYAQTIAANFPGLVNEAHSFNGPGVPSVYVPYDLPGHHIFNHIRADWADMDPIGKFAVHQGNVIFYPTANREGSLDPIYQHAMGPFADALRAGMKPYPGAKLITFDVKHTDQNQMLQSIINFGENLKPAVQRVAENKDLYLTDLNSKVFEVFEECSTLIKGITGHENYYFDMVASDSVKAAQYYKKDLMDIKKIVNDECDVLLQNPTDDNIEKFRRIVTELVANVAEKLHQVHERNKAEASKSIFTKVKNWFGY